MQNKFMSNPEQPIEMDDSIAKISGDTVEIFGQRFPLKLPFYFPSGKLKSFAIDFTIIKYNGRELPIGMNIFLYENDSRFHWSTIYRGYAYEHKGQTFQIGGGIYFYPSINLEKFTVDEKIETNFIVNGKKLVLYKGDTIAFHEYSGLPKTVWRRYEESFQGKDYNVLEISEDGKIIDRIMEKRPNYDYD
jgi:hypothetical protein